MPNPDDWTVKQLQEVMSNLRLLRSKFKMPISKMSSILGFHINTVRRWEYGDVCPDTASVLRLAEGLYKMGYSPPPSKWPSHTVKEVMEAMQRLPATREAAMRIGVTKGAIENWNRNGCGDLPFKTTIKVDEYLVQKEYENEHSSKRDFA